MREPKRLLTDGATDFERRLLGAVMNERPAPALRSRMQRGLGLVGPLMWVSNVKAMLGDVASKGTAAKVALGVAATGVVAAGGLAVAFGLSSFQEPKAAGPAAEVESVSAKAPSNSPEVTALPVQPVSVPALSVAPPAVQPSAADHSAVEVSRPGAVQPSVSAEPSRPSLPLGAGAPAGAPAQRAVAAPEAEAAPAAAADDDGTASQLREEIALLDNVRNALQTGERARALAALDQYRTRFPRGLLGREAALLRRQAGAKRAAERLREPAAAANLAAPAPQTGAAARAP